MQTLPVFHWPVITTQSLPPILASPIFTRCLWQHHVANILIPFAKRLTILWELPKVPPQQSIWAKPPIIGFHQFRPRSVNIVSKSNLTTWENFQARNEFDYHVTRESRERNESENNASAIKIKHKRQFGPDRIRFVQINAGKQLHVARENINKTSKWLISESCNSKVNKNMQDLE